MKIDIIQLKFLHFKLRRVLAWLEKETGLEFVGTSLFRMDDKGVHGTLPVRGGDLRIRNRKIGLAIEAVINDAWVYDPSRPDKKCAFLHGEGSNMHLHTQVHPNTRKR